MLRRDDATDQLFKLISDPFSAEASRLYHLSALHEESFH